MKIDNVLTEEIDWSQWTDRQLDGAASLGLGPKYKPKPPKMYECPACKQMAAKWRTAHEDTSMETSYLACTKCDYTGNY